MAQVWSAFLLFAFFLNHKNTNIEAKTPDNSQLCVEGSEKFITLTSMTIDKITSYTYMQPFFWIQIQKQEAAGSKINNEEQQHPKVKELE